jgi:hypothetical protein
VLGPVGKKSIFGPLAKAWKGLVGVCTEPPPKIPSFDLLASTVEGPEGEKIDVPKWGPAVLFRGTAGRPYKVTGVLDGPKDVLHVSHPLLPSGGFVVPAGKNLRPAL